MEGGVFIFGLRFVYILFFSSVYLVLVYSYSLINRCGLIVFYLDCKFLEGKNLCFMFVVYFLGFCLVRREWDLNGFIY